MAGGGRALATLYCPDCGAERGAGPTECPACELANGFRYAASELRDGKPTMIEHAIRVSSAVARTRHRYPAAARCGYELALPTLLAGTLPTTAQAQRAKAWINALPSAEAETVTELPGW